MNIILAMEELAGELRAAGIGRPVHTDPRNVVATPCVLIEPPALAPTASYCSSGRGTFQVLVVGLPGARAELVGLSSLLSAVLDVLDWTEANPVGYTPLTAPGTAEPCQAYRVTVERDIS